MNNYQTHLLAQKRVTKLYIPTINALIKIDVPIGQVNVANESKSCIKCGKLDNYKDKNSQERKGSKNQDGQIDDTVTLE